MTNYRTSYLTNKYDVENYKEAKISCTRMKLSTAPESVKTR